MLCWAKMAACAKWIPHKPKTLTRPSSCHPGAARGARRNPAVAGTLAPVPTPRPSRSWVERAVGRTEGDPETREFLLSARQLIVDRLDFQGFIRHAMTWFETTLDSAVDEAEDVFADFKDEKAIWSELQKQVFEKYGLEDVTLQVLLQEFDLTPKLPPVPPDAIRCLTIASSKGLEFGYVYLVGMVEDQLPSFHSIKKGPLSREIQEERRNCFVAITRAESTLTLTYANSYFGWRKEPSRFLREMGLIK